ncbi:hypothetical protein [Sinorhizobium meliloti]
MAKFRVSGSAWQRRMNEALRRATCL